MSPIYRGPRQPDTRIEAVTREVAILEFCSRRQKNAVGFERDRILDKHIEHVERRIGRIKSLIDGALRSAGSAAVTKAPDDVLARSPNHVMIEVEIDGVAGFAGFRTGPGVVVKIKLKRGIGAARKFVVPPAQDISTGKVESRIQIIGNGRIDRKDMNDRASFGTAVEVSLQRERVFGGNRCVRPESAVQEVPGIVARGAVQFGQRAMIEVLGEAR